MKGRRPPLPKSGDPPVGRGLAGSVAEREVR